MNANQTPKVPQKNNRRDSATEQIKHYIRSRQLKPGELLPPVRALSEYFGYSRDATWRALKNLREENWIRAKANRRYVVADEVYTQILRSIKIHAIFCGENYIQFTGFRRLADQLKAKSTYHNFHLNISLNPHKSSIPNSIWENSDVLLVDSDSSRKLLEKFNKFPIPVIGLDADYSDRYYANIVTDHHLGGRIAAERLIKRGAKKAQICFFGGSENNPRVEPRIAGFREAWLEAGLSEKDLSFIKNQWCENHFEIALKLHKQLTKTPVDHSLFVTDGRLAATYLQVLDYLKYEIPAKIKLVGYDGLQIGSTTNPPMTTIQQNMEQIAETAIKLIADYPEIHKEQHRVIRITPSLIARKSD